MSNVKHPKCPIRNMASEAKKRLASGDYSEKYIPKNITSSQKEIYFKLQKMKKDGEELTSPVAQLGDQKLLATLPHEEKQRYIIRLCEDYIKVKAIIEKEIS